MVISVYNHKGGTGKTTTVLNIGKSLQLAGLNVLLVDLDPQANLTYSLGVERNQPDMVSLSEENLVTIENGLDLIPNYTSPQFLVDYDFPTPNSLAEELNHVFNQYDYVLLDCPPAMNMTVVNAILASEGLIIPVKLDPLSIEGLGQVVTAITELLYTHNHHIPFASILPVMVDSRRQLTDEVIQFIKENFELELFTSQIRMNVKIAESPSYGKSVLSYASNSNGAKDFQKVTEELIKKINQLEFINN